MFKMSTPVSASCSLEKKKHIIKSDNTHHTAAADNSHNDNRSDNSDNSEKDESTKNTSPSEQPYQTKGPRFWLILSSVYVSFFLVALDRLIIATAIPSITNTFGSIQDIGWYGSAYMLTCALANPCYGKLYQLYDTKRTYLTSILVFETGSALCGAAPSSLALIIGRAIAGIGAAGIGCGAIMVIIPLVPLHKRPVFTSFFGMAFGVASVLGPFIGGAFTDSGRLTWRFCFYINLPIGALAFAAIFFLLRLPVKPRESVPLRDQIWRLDPLGVVLFAPSMMCFILALQWGGSKYSWTDPTIVGLLVAFAVLLAAFLFVEYKQPDRAMAPSRVVLNRSVGGSMLFTFFMAGGMMNAVYYIAIWFQAAQGQSALQAGVRTIPLVLSLVVFGIFSATFTQKIGYYLPAMLVSPVVAAIGSGLLSTLSPHASAGKWIGFQVLYGSGLGIGAQTANLATQVVLPREDVALGLAMMFFMQQLGGSVFLAVGQSIFSRQLVAKLSGTAGLDTKTIVDTGATDLRYVVPADKMDGVARSYSYALNRVFILSAALSACMLLGSLMVEWRSIKRPDGLAARNAEDVEKDSQGER